MKYGYFQLKNLVQKQLEFGGIFYENIKKDFIQANPSKLWKHCFPIVQLKYEGNKKMYKFKLKCKFRNNIAHLNLSHFRWRKILKMSAINNAISQAINIDIYNNFLHERATLDFFLVGNFKNV